MGAMLSVHSPVHMGERGVGVLRSSRGGRPNTFRMNVTPNEDLFSTLAPPSLIARVLGFATGLPRGGIYVETS